MVARLGPGSPAPGNSAEVEELLRLVPLVAFLPELEPLVPAPLGPGPLTPQTLLAGADAAWLARLGRALRALETRADAEANGGLRFLAVTLRHFLEAQPVSPSEHPLVVALFARTDARRRGRPGPGESGPAESSPAESGPGSTALDDPNEVARVLDGW